MIVATRAAHGHAQESDGCGLYSVHYIFVLIFLRYRAAFEIDHVIAIETACDLLIDARVGQQIAGQLLDDELAVRHVPIECADHPIAPVPHVAMTVDMVAVRVGVTSQIQPLHRHALAIPRRIQQSINLFLIRIARAIRKERVELRGSWRKAREIERQAAKQSGLRRFRRRLQILTFQSRQYKLIDGISHPLLVFHFRQGRGLRRHIGPMHFPLRALIDPAPH